MITFYLVVAIILTLVSIFATVGTIVEYIGSRPSQKQTAAREVLVALLVLPAGWLWPLTLPLAFMWAIYHFGRVAMGER